MPRISKKTVTGRRERQESRRMEAARLFAAGQTRAQAARTLKVSWRAAHTWYQDWQQGGVVALKATAKPGPKPKFGDEEVARLEKQLRRGPKAHGYENELWNLPRVGRLVHELFGKKASPSEVWRLLRRLRWSPQKPVRRARERKEDQIKAWKEETWPQLKAKAQAEQRTIVFVDESGLSQKPAAKNTWAPEGETPVLELNFNWKKLSVIGGITLRSVYFQLHETSIKAPEIIAFLDHLQQQIAGKLLVIWDGLPAHRATLVKEYLATTENRVWVERLPGYAPELNPIEYLWGYAKGNDLANLAPKNLVELSTAAHAAFTRVGKLERCLRAFWVQTELNLEEI
jgi:transposase